MKLAFIDAETTGIRPDMGAEVWEIALILREDVAAMSPDGPPSPGRQDSEYAWQVRPDLTRADPVALKIGGYYRRCQVAREAVGAARDLKRPNADATTADEVASATARLLDGALIVGANPWFDHGHLDAFLRSHGQCLAPDYHMVDIGSLVTGWIAGKTAGFNEVADLMAGAHRECDWPAPTRAEARGFAGPLKLSTAASFAGLDPAAYDAHTALGDARLARDIWDAVISP